MIPIKNSQENKGIFVKILNLNAIMVMVTEKKPEMGPGQVPHKMFSHLVQPFRRL